MKEKEQFNYIFERYEKKYLLTPEKYEMFRCAIQPYMIEDAYGLSTICNIYFDTPGYDIIRTSIDGPTYKEKLRIRSYGVPKDEKSTVFIEIKKKYKGIVYKRRVAMTLEQSKDYLEKGIKPFDSQIIREIDYFLKLYKPIPKVFIAYNRVALFCKNDMNLRMTFDWNIRSRTNDLSLDKGSDGVNLLNHDEKYLMEIKIFEAMPIWLCELLSKYEIYPISFSKYGNVYKNNVVYSAMAEFEEKVYV